MSGIREKSGRRQARHTKRRTLRCSIRRDDLLTPRWFKNNGEKEKILRPYGCRILRGGDKRDRTADLLNAIQALSQLSYTPTGKVYLIRKQHECQERFFDSAKKICAAVLPPAQTGFFRLLRSRLTVAADDPGDGGSQLFVAVRVEMLAIERTHLRERAGIEKAQAVRLGDHAVLLCHALRHGE